MDRADTLKPTPRTAATSRRRGPKAMALALGVFVVAASGPALAAEAFYLGTWTFVSAQRAPWADPKHPLDEAEPARLHGRSVVIGPRTLSGPPPYMCRAPHYVVHDYAADMLFEGAFGEMHDRDKSADPAKIAASLGFRAPTTKTLESGCDFDIHFVDATTAKVGLNDYVYTLKRR